MRQSHCSTRCWKCLQTVHPSSWGDARSQAVRVQCRESRNLGRGSRWEGHNRAQVVLFRSLADVRLSTPAAWGSTSGEGPACILFCKKSGREELPGNPPLPECWALGFFTRWGGGFRPKAQERYLQAHPQRESLWRCAHQMHLPPSAAQPRTAPVALAPVRTSDIICRPRTDENAGPVDQSY